MKYENIEEIRKLKREEAEIVNRINEGEVSIENTQKLRRIAIRFNEIYEGFK